MPRLVRIRFGHSPDPDDAFMFWALTTDLVDDKGLEFEQVLADIQTLNQWARAARLEVTAISLAAYPFVQEDYALLPHGASIGAGYGPIVVAREPIPRDELGKTEIVVPGALVCAAGANRPGARELDDVVLERAGFVCCDSVDDARLESSDLIEPVAHGVLDWLEVHELQEVVAGEVQGRQSGSDIVVFKSNGLAAWDLALGAEALRRARDAGIGLEV